MKLCKSNVFVNKILIKDEERNLKVFNYECHPDIAKLLVSKYPEVHLDINELYTVPVYTFKFENEKQFNLLAIKAIHKACIYNSHKTHSTLRINNHFKDNKYSFGYTLVSKDLELTKDVYNKLFECLGIIDGSMIEMLNIIKVDGLAVNNVIFTPVADHLGVVSIGGDDLDHYGIGIINSRAPYLFQLS